MTKKILFATIAIAVLGAKAQAYDVEGIYNFGLVSRGSKTIEGNCTYSWTVDDKAFTTECEVADNYGYSYSYVWNDSEQYDNGTVAIYEDDGVDYVFETVWSYDEVYYDDNGVYGIEDGLVVAR